MEKINPSNEIVLPDLPISIIGMESYETFAIDSKTIGVRPKWISVKDHLPELNKNDQSEIVMVNTQNDGILVAHLNLYRKGGNRKEDHYSWSEEGTGCGCCASSITVTHWMPLPNVPNQ